MKVLLKNEIIVYEKLGDFEKALDKIEGYVSAYPNDEDARREKTFVISRINNQ